MQFNPTNYPSVVPVAADSVLLWQDSSGAIKSGTVQALADAVASISSLNVSVTVINSVYTLSDEQEVVADSASAFDVTLPDSAINTGKTYRVFNKGSGAVTLVAAGTDTIAGSATLVLAQYESVIITSDGLGMWTAFGAP